MPSRTIIGDPMPCRAGSGQSRGTAPLGIRDPHANSSTGSSQDDAAGPTECTTLGR
jgi:hypothetical protein